MLTAILVWVLGLTAGTAVVQRDAIAALRVGGRSVLLGLLYATILNAFAAWHVPMALGIIVATIAYIAVSLLLWRLPAILAADGPTTSHFIVQRLVLLFVLNAAIPTTSHFFEPQAYQFILNDPTRMKLIMDLTVTTAFFSVVALIIYAVEARHRLDGLIGTALALPWPDDPDPLQQMKDFAAATLPADELEIRATPPRSRFEIGTPFQTQSGEQRYLIALRNPGRSPLLDRDLQALSAIARIGQETMRVRGEANELRTEANTDSLTGLFNYRGFQIAISDVNSRRSDQSGIAVVYLDLDGFTGVNDQYGHEIGNHLLREVAHRLQEAVRPRDTVARAGGDEFVVLLRDIKDQAHAQQVAHRIVAAASAPVTVGKRVLPMKISEGLRFSDDPGESIDTLVNDADSSMYATRGRLLAFEPEVEADTEAESTTPGRRAAIAELITGRRLDVAYQPVVDASKGTIVAVEALVRGTHPDLGAVDASVLVHEAARLNLLDLLTEQVLTQTFVDFPRLQRSIPGLEAVHVNVELGQLTSGGTHQLLLELGDAHPETRLCVEITENSLNHAGEDVLGKLAELRASGIKVALDDFGQGYSTMLAIVDFPFDSLKIDRSLIATITESRKSNYVIRSLAQLCRSLHVSMIVEGVERMEERDVLLHLGARHMQGYLFSEPVSVDRLCEKYAARELNLS
jgi:diguanylate cyclase (GGDEF)-like protein